jgi:hypothetical protein
LGEKGVHEDGSCRIVCDWPLQHECWVSKESQEALDHFRRAADLFTLLGDEINMMTAKKNISKVEARLNGIEYEEGSNLSFSQKQYNYWLEKLGEHHPITLRRGELYAHALYCLNQGVTAERLLTKLAATSYRVHGPVHNCTLSATSALKDIQERSCVVKGPVPESAGGSSTNFSRSALST